MHCIHKTLDAVNASLIVQWISTKDNVPADTLSRVNLGDEFKLNPEVFAQIASIVGGLDIDRFATAANTQCKKFNSYFMEPQCTGVDAFAQTDWLHLRNFCNPPFT